MHRHAKVTFAMHRADSRQAGISQGRPMTARARCGVLGLCALLLAACTLGSLWLGSKDLAPPTYGAR